MSPRTPLLALCLSVLPLVAVAQKNYPQVEDLIKFGGHLQMLATECSGASEEELRQTRDNKQSFAVQEFGISQEEFQTLFSQGLKEAQAEWKKTSPTDRQAICDDVRNPDAG